MYSMDPLPATREDGCVGVPPERLASRSNTAGNERCTAVPKTLSLAEAARADGVPPAVLIGKLSDFF